MSYLSSVIWILSLGSTHSACNKTILPAEALRAHPYIVCAFFVRSQVQSNALAALEAIDQGVADQVLDEGCITGDRINGLCDGVTGDWCVHACHD